jgi:hypothetical protein
MQLFVSATAGTSGYTMNSAGTNSLVLTRKYTPTWAIVVAVIGIIVFLIGLLALLVKNTESLTVTLTEVPEGTRVNITGVATPDMISRFHGVLSAVSTATAAEVPEAP